MQPVEVEELCRTVLPGTGELDIEPLGHGLISETYRVRRDGLAYTLKAAAPNCEQFGLSFAWEVKLLEAAGESGLAPPLVYHDAKRVLILRWVIGHPWSAQGAGLPQNIRRMAQLLRRVHALPIPLPSNFKGPQWWIDHYRAMLVRETRRRPDAGLAEAAAVHLHELEQLAQPAGVVCHSDLHAMNVLQCDDRLILLDWEYAHVSDPLWDLAGWCANNDFETQTQRELLLEYLGQPACPNQWVRFRLLMWLYDYVCLLWGELLSMRGDASPDLSRRAGKLDARLHLAAHYAA
jgi:aminoglycoside phosphotransferase (APT) family kinase protein